MFNGIAKKRGILKSERDRRPN